VLGILCGIVGTLQATEAIKLILGEGDPLIGKLLIFDAMGMDFTKVNVKWDPECPVCGKHPTITEPIDYDQKFAPGVNIILIEKNLVGKSSILKTIKFESKKPGAER
jgi:hypothetical protein